MEKLSNYIKDTISEMKQVAWPSQSQAILYTILVIVISLVVALFLGAFDFLFTEGVNLIITNF